MAKILLVDDEPTIRELLKTVLSFARHDVHLASNGEEALKIFMDAQSPFDLIITDMIMPEADGFRLVEEIALRDPKAKIIIMSGWFNEEELKITQASVSKSIRGIIRKPCTMDKIQSLLNKVLDED